MRPETENSELIEGFYDWGPGVVVAADCLGRSYQTALGEHRLVVTMPSFDGTAVVEPPLRYKRPDTYVNVDPPNPWGELRSWNNAANGMPIPVTVCVKRVRILLAVTADEAADQQLGPQLDDALTPWWDSLSSWIEVVPVKTWRPSAIGDQDSLRLFISGQANRTARCVRSP